MKLTEYISRVISKHVDHVFVGNGGVVITLLDSLANHVQVVPCEHEQGAAIAAESYARVRRSIGVAVATSGPGFLNLVQGIACAYYDSVPVLYIVGAPPLKQLKLNDVRQQGFQEMDVCNVVSTFTKKAVRLIKADDVASVMKDLLITATSGRPGPVLLEIPDDVQRAEVSIRPEDEVIDLSKKAVKLYPGEADIRELVNEFTKANRPLVIMGAGVKIAKREEQAKIFLSWKTIPYVTTWGAVDLFPADDPCNVGGFGISHNFPGNFAVQNADVILVLGSKLDTHQTGGDPSTFAPKAKIFMVDIDRNELDKINGLNNRIRKIHCDLECFFEMCSFIQVGEKKEWLEQISKWKSEYPICKPEYREQKGEYVNPYVFMEELSKQTSEDAIIITDAGATLTWTMQGYTPKFGQSLFSAFNHSPMGYALPAAIGAQFAAPERQVVCIIGDGGMQMNVQELATIAYNKLPIKIFMMDNQGYGIIRQTQDTWMNGRYVAAGPESGLGMPDMVKISDAYGIEEGRICHSESITSILSYEKSVFCRVKIDPKQKIIPKLVFGKSIEHLS